MPTSPNVSLPIASTPKNPPTQARPATAPPPSLSSASRTAPASPPTSPSQQRLALERIAIARHSRYRLAAIEAGLFSNYLNFAMCTPEDGNILQTSKFRAASPPSTGTLFPPHLRLPSRQ